MFPQTNCARKEVVVYPFPVMMVYVRATRQSRCCKHTTATCFYNMPLNISMTMSSNGNIFRVTGPLCGEFTGHR